MQGAVTNAAQRVFIDGNGQMWDLNSQIGSAASLYTLTNDMGINDSGQIVGNGLVNATGQEVAFLLTPTALPLPGSAWLP